MSYAIDHYSMHEITTIQVSKEVARKLKELFPGATYESAILQLLKEAEEEEYITIPATIDSGASKEFSETNRYDGRLKKIIVDFDLACSGKVYFSFRIDSKEKRRRTIVPEIPLRKPPLELNPNKPVKSGDKFTMALKNKGEYPHDITLFCIIKTRGETQW